MLKNTISRSTLVASVAALVLAMSLVASQAAGGQAATATERAQLAAAARWERRHLASSTRPISRIDIEAAFLLSVPLLRLPAGLSGTCRIAAELPNGKRRQLAGVMIGVQNGNVVSCATHIEAARRSVAANVTACKTPSGNTLPGAGGSRRNQRTRGRSGAISRAPTPPILLSILVEPSTRSALVRPCDESRVAVPSNAMPTNPLSSQGTPDGRLVTFRPADPR